MDEQTTREDVRADQCGDFSSYLDIAVSDESKDKLKIFFAKYPDVKTEIFEHTKNSMANTIYKDNQSRDYINGVKDTLKFISKYF